MAEATAIRARRGLAEVLVRTRSDVQVDPAGYVGRIEDNLIPGVDRELFWQEFEAGAGQELTERTGRDGLVLRPKALAAHSSAVLAVNSFARWKTTPKHLAIAGATGFEHIRFEQHCPTGLPGTPPTLDLLAEGPTLSSVSSPSARSICSRRRPSSQSLTDRCRTS